MRSLHATIYGDRRPARGRAFTLIEMLVVIAIVGLITAITMPIMSAASDARRVREGARLLSTMIATAQARARANGRSAGVWLQPMGNNSSGVMNLFIAECPPPYCGDTFNATASVKPDQTHPGYLDVNFPASDIGWKTVKGGDLVRLNYRGAYYQISTYTTAFGQVIPSAAVIVQPLSPTTTPPLPPVPPSQSSQGGLNLPFQVFRQPVRAYEGAVSLVDGAVIDVQSSGQDGGNFFPLSGAANPLIVTFDNTGTLEFMYQYNQDGTLSIATPLTGVYFLVGKVEKLLPIGTQLTYNAVTKDISQKLNSLNITDLDSRWVGVTRQGGLATTAENAMLLLASGSGKPEPDLPSVLSSARRFVRSAQSMGGQ